MVKKLYQENNAIPEIRILVNSLEIESDKEDKNILLKDRLDLKEFEGQLNHNYTYLDSMDESVDRPVKVFV